MRDENTRSQPEISLRLVDTNRKSDARRQHSSQEETTKQETKKPQSMLKNHMFDGEEMITITTDSIQIHLPWVGPGPRTKGENKENCFQFQVDLIIDGIETGMKTKRRQ